MGRCDCCDEDYDGPDGGLCGDCAESVVGILDDFCESELEREQDGTGEGMMGEVERIIEALELESAALRDVANAIERRIRELRGCLPPKDMQASAAPQAAEGE